MAVKEIIRMGHPTLRKVAEKIDPSEIETPEFKLLVEDMIDSMNEAGGIGLAAPQIGISKQIALIQLESENRYEEEEEELELTVIMNPEINILTDETQGFWEGCLSVPGLRGYVERPSKIQVSFLALDGKQYSVELEGFVATVFQHEIDHLFGKIYIDHIKDMTKLSYEEEFEKYQEQPEPELD